MGPVKAKILYIIIAAWIVLLVVPTAAFALDQGGTELLSRKVSTVSGAEMAEDMVDQLEGVEVGSSATTVTLDVDGKPQQIAIGYEQLLSKAGMEGGAAGLVPLALISAGVGGALKFLTVLMRLGR